MFHLDSIWSAPLLFIFILTHVTVITKLTCSREYVERTKIPVEAEVLIFMSTQKLWMDPQFNLSLLLNYSDILTSNLNLLCAFYTQQVSRVHVSACLPFLSFLSHSLWNEWFTWHLVSTFKTKVTLNLCFLYPVVRTSVLGATLTPFNLLKTKRRLSYLKPQSVPRCKHFSSRL